MNERGVIHDGSYLVVIQNDLGSRSLSRGMTSIRRLGWVSSQPLGKIEKKQWGEACCCGKTMVKLAITDEAEMRALCLDGSFAWQIDVGWTFDFGLTSNFSRILHGHLNDRRVIFVLPVWGVVGVIWSSSIVEVDGTPFFICDYLRCQ